jgi:hypothetical protein
MAGKNENFRLNYFQWDPKFSEVKPYELLLGDIPDGFPIKNFDVAPEKAEIIYDVRGHEELFTLENNGCCFTEQKLDISTWTKETIEDVYLGKVEHLLRSTIPDVDDLFIFDWRVF